MNITIKDLLDAGVHFGHQTKRWNPKSKKYIFDHRQGVSIVDLEKTYELLGKACEFITNHVADGKNIRLDNIADADADGVFKPEFSECLFGGDIGLLEMALHRFA